MTANTIDLESLTYHESESESEPAPLPSRTVNRIELNGQWYRRVDDIAGRRRGKKKSSHIWGEGKGFAMVHEATGVKYYYCCQCLDEKKDKTYKPLTLDGNSTVLSHWKRTHKIDKKGNPIKPKGMIQQYVEQQDYIWNVWFEAFKLLLIRWLVYCHIAFYQIENAYFIEMIQYMHKGLSKLIPSRNTIRKWVMSEFRKQKRQLRDDLREARSNIHLSFDLWTSLNYYAIIAIVAHYIDKKGLRQTKLLAIRRLEGEHSGANQAQIVLDVISEYKIGGRIGYFMLDNASSNDTAVDLILRTLYPKMSEKQRKRRRLRCLGHVVNLAAQAFLLGKKADTTLEELELAYSRHDFESIAKIWRKQGALGRLHNIIRYIRMSPQRREEFRRIVVGGEWSEFDMLELIQSNATRWNSYFSSIVRAINCKPRIQQFCDTHMPKRGEGLENDRLTPHHWFLLEKLSSVLQPFYEATLCGQGHKHTLSRWFTAMNWLLNCIYDAQVDFRDLRIDHGDSEEYTYLEAAACASWEKCEEYYNKADDSAAYYAAQVLLPEKKWWWFHQEFDLHENKKHWVAGDPKDINNRGIKGLVEDLWLEEHKGKYSTPAVLKPSPPIRYITGEQFGGLKEHEQIKAVPVCRTDDYQAYIQSNREEVDNPLAYWNSLYSSKPDLARFALDMLAIPLMSAECERVFSSAKHLLTDSRSRLKADIIEANECLKSWFGRPQAKAFAKGVDPDVDEQYEEEAATKAAVKTIANAEGNITGGVAVDEQEADKSEDEEEEEEEDSDDEDDSDEDNEEVDGNEVKYTLIDN